MGWVGWVVGGRWAEGWTWGGVVERMHRKANGGVEVKLCRLLQVRMHASIKWEMHAHRSTTGSKLSDSPLSVQQLLASLIALSNIASVT